MKQYIATVTLKGGIWRDRRKKLAVGPLRAHSKEHAAEIALEIVSKDKTVSGWEQITCSKSSVRATSIQPA